MGELVRKELKSFFCLAVRLCGVGVFFCLLMVCFCGSFREDIIFRQVAWPTCRLFLPLLRFLYLFLVPALCMRLFAEERRTGTLELLLTRPLTTWQIVGAKYLAGFLLVLFFDITYPRLSGQFMVFSPAGRTYRCGRNYRFVYRVDFLIRHICGCRGLGFGFDRKSDYCFSLHPGGGFFVVYRSRLYSRYSFV